MEAASNMRTLLTLTLAAMCGCAAAQAQPAPEPGLVVEVVAKDMREETVRIPVTVKDMYNRQETRTIPIIIFRPPGDGPFPLLVFNHGRAVPAKRATQGRNKLHPVRGCVHALKGQGFAAIGPTLPWTGPYVGEPSTGAMAIWLRPRFLARYSAWSARSKTSRKLRSWGLMVPTPTLTVMR